MACRHVGVVRRRIVRIADVAVLVLRRLVGPGVVHLLDERAPADQVPLAKPLESQFASALVAHQVTERTVVAQQALVGLDARAFADFPDGLLGLVVRRPGVFVDRLGVHQQHVGVAKDREVDRRVEALGRHLFLVDRLAAPFAGVADGAHHRRVVNQIGGVERVLDRLVQPLDVGHGEIVVVDPRRLEHALRLLQVARHGLARLVLVRDFLVVHSAVVVARQVPRQPLVDDRGAGRFVCRAVVLPVELPEGVGAVVVAVGVVAGPLRVVGRSRLRPQADQVADAAVRPVGRTGAVAEEFGLPH